MRHMNRRVIRGIFTGFWALAVLFVFCGKKSNVNNPVQEVEQDEVQTSTFEPGTPDSLVFKGRLAIRFPEAAFSARTEVQARELDPEANLDFYACAGTLSRAYVLTPNGAMMDESARAEFDLSQIKLPSGMTTDSLEIYAYDGDSFECLNARAEGGKLACYLKRLSMIFVRFYSPTEGLCNFILPGGELKIYKQQNYLCLDNAFGDLTMNPFRAKCPLIDVPVHFEASYRVSLLAPGTGVDRPVWSKQSSRIVWLNNQVSYEPGWNPGHVRSDGCLTNEEVMSDDIPQVLFRSWKENGSVSASATYGDEMLIQFDASGEAVGPAARLPRRTLQLDWPDFLRRVFVGDDMRRFIELSKLDENQTYQVKVEMVFNDWQSKASLSIAGPEFILNDIPFDENPAQPPVVDIASPVTGSIFKFAEEIQFQAVITDPQNLGIKSVFWRSDVDGLLGNSINLKRRDLSAGKHALTCLATSKGGLSGYDQVFIEVGLPTYNTTPTASFSAIPDSGTTRTLFFFDGFGSWDNEDRKAAMKVRWDWQNDGNWDTRFSPSKTEFHQFEEEGRYTVKMEVKDTGDLRSECTHEIIVVPVP